MTPLEMAYAYNTLANGGARISGTEASRGNGDGPVAIDKVVDRGQDKPVPDNLGGERREREGLQPGVDPTVAQNATDILHTVVTSGTGRTRPGRRRLHLGQDRHDRQQRRRLVRRRQRGHHGGGLGRLPGRSDADGDRVRGLARRRRNDPGAELSAYIVSA